MSFQHAPVTKGLMIACGLITLAVAIFDVKHYFHLQLVPHLSRDHQYWRLLTHLLALGNSSDLFVWEILVFNTSISIERAFGSVKFASYLVISTLVATIFEFLSLPALYRYGLNYLPPGPISLAFGILYQYSRVVPSAYRFSLFGAVVSDKIFVYLLALQLAISRPWSSTVLACIGLLTGAFYRTDVVNLKSFRLPAWFLRLCSKFLSPLVGDLRPPRRSPRALPDESSEHSVLEQEPAAITTARQQPSHSPTTATELPQEGGTSVMREWVNELTGRTERTSTGIGRVPPEAEITQLTSMFPDLHRDVVVAALQRSTNIEGAVETLLSSSQ